MEDNKIEFTPNAAKRIFELYIENENLGGKIEVWDIWEKGFTNPIQFIHEYLKEIAQDGDNVTVALGVSTKDAGDEKRFSRMKQDFAEFPNLELRAIPRQPLGNISATDMRDAITSALQGGDINKLQKFIPQGVSAETLLKIVEEQPTWLVEACSMASGAVAGASGKEDSETLIREEDIFMIDRKQFIEELALRESIRNALSRVKEKRLNEEQQVRRAIRKMIQEEVKDTPYKSTGINELETLLKKIVPVIEPDYKSLTTAEEQRTSYRAHILNAVQNSLSPTGAAGAMHRDDIERPRHSRRRGFRFRS